MTLLMRDDVICARCGYNLRGLQVDARCPECGDAVAPSVWLADQPADPRWRRVVRFGLAMLLAMTGVAMTLVFMQPSAFWLDVTLTYAAWWGNALAVMLVTRRPERPHRGWESYSLRPALRWLTLAAATLPLLMTMQLYRPSNAAYFLTIGATLLLHFYLAGLASRRGWRFMSWQFPVAGGAIAAAVIVSLDAYLPPYMLPVNAYFNEYSSCFPLTGVGIPAALRWAARPLIGNRPFRPMDWKVILMLAGAIWSTALIATMWWRLRPCGSGDSS